MHSALEDLTSEVKTIKSDVVDYSSAFSINGLGKQQGGGMYFYHSGDDVADTYALGISPKFSFLVESMFSQKCSDAHQPCGLNQVLDLRNRYLQAKELLVEAAALEFKVEAANAGMKMTDRIAGEAMAAKILLPSVENPPLDQLKAELTKVTEQFRHATIKADAAKLAIITQMSTGNLLIARWNTEKSSSASGQLTDDASIQKDKKTSSNGVVVLGDLRVTTIVPGEDYLKALLDLEMPLSLLAGKVGIVTYALQAKHVAYVQESDYEASLAAKLVLSAEKIKGYVDNIQELYKALNLKLGYQMSELANVGNAGVISGASVAVKNYSFCDGSEHEKSIKAELDRSNGYTTVYAVRTLPKQFAEYVNKLENKKKMELSNKLKCGN